MGRVIVLGSLMTDLVAYAARLPLAGESLLGEDFGMFLGGKGMNQAVAAARCGAQVSLVGRVGTDSFGDAFFPALARAGIADTYVTRDPAVGSGTACILIGAESGQNVIVATPRANLTLTAGQVEEALTALLPLSSHNTPASQDRVIFLAQCETSMASVAAGIRRAHALGCYTMLNTAPVPREPLDATLYALLDLLIANEVEAGALAGGMTVDGPDAAQVAAERLLRLGARGVIVTLGAQGAVWRLRAPEHGSADATGHMGDTCGWLQPIPVQAVDATAAGDAFCGALAARLAEGARFADALAWGNAAGALAVTRKGAQPSLPTADEIRALLAGGGSAA
ncbi:MAG: ribokinase [Ktedonobacterales bacterium]